MSKSSCFTPGTNLAFASLRWTWPAAWSSFAIPKARHTIGWTGAGGPNRYYIENTLEGVTEPGEWYLDRTAGKLYYWPQENAPANGQVVAPAVLRQLLRFEGNVDAGDYVEYLNVSGFTFSDTDWSLPENGYPDCGDVGDIVDPSAITYQAARFCQFTHNRVRNTGTYALEVTGDGNLISENEMFDTGGGGIISRSYGNADEPGGVFEKRHTARVDASSAFARGENLMHMSDETKPGYIRCGAYPCFPHKFACPLIQCCHGQGDLPDDILAAHPCFYPGRNNACAYLFRQQYCITGTGFRVFKDHAGMYRPEDCESVFRFLVPDRMAADNRHTGLAHFIDPALHNLFQGGEELRLVRKHRKVQRRDRLPSHRVYVRQRIGCRDCTKPVGIVDYRGEEVGRKNNCEFGSEAVYSCIIRVRSADQYIRIRNIRQLTQNLGQVRWTEFGCSAGAG